MNSKRTLGRKKSDDPIAEPFSAHGMREDNEKIIATVTRSDQSLLEARALMPASCNWLPGMRRAFKGQKNEAEQETMNKINHLSSFTQ